MAGGGQGATKRALGGDTGLQKLPQIAVLHVLEHGVQRLVVTAHADQSDDVGVLQTRHRPRVLVELSPVQNEHQQHAGIQPQLPVDSSGVFAGGGEGEGEREIYLPLKTISITPVSYTHLTLPTIYSV